MNRFIPLLFASIALVCQISCSDNGDGESSFDVDFVVPESVTIAPEENTIAFRVRFSKSPEESDVIVLESSGKSFDCRIVAVSKSNFTIQLADGISAGVYGVSIRRGKTVKEMGTMFLIVSAAEIKPDAGSTVYGIVTCDGKGLEGVVVSDGFEVVKTDADGVYQLKSAKELGYVFVSLPSGYEAACVGSQPKIHYTLKTAASVPERVDFSLTNAGDQSDHVMLALGDLHLANRGVNSNNDLNQYLQFVSDINTYIAANSGRKVYALTLGDISWDIYWESKGFDLNKALEYLNKINSIPVFNTIGNHDHACLSGVIGDMDCARFWREIIAPTYYSFNIGDVHYVVLDDIVANNTGTGTSDSRVHIPDLSDDNINWLKKDLSFVPKSKSVVLALHAPLYSLPSADQTAIAAAVNGYKNVQVISGHTHKMNNSVAATHFEHNSGAVCATWWWTGKYFPGVNIGQDGAPGGYQIFDVSGTDFKWAFKPTGKDTEIQFRTYDRNQIAITADKYMDASAADTYKAAFNKLASSWSSASSDNEVYINVWNYDPQWKIEVTENGTRLDATRVTLCDPLHLITYSAPAMKSTTDPTFKTSSTNHIWKVKASSANSTLEVKVTDRFGNVYTELMKRPKTFSVETYKF
ncbi:MAG: calcineurin-like phosphoesterase C-terminal domain-containing protein [Candidatus Cryptobacteroides sp.]